MYYFSMMLWLANLYTFYPHIGHGSTHDDLTILLSTLINSRQYKGMAIIIHIFLI